MRRCAIIQSSMSLWLLQWCDKCSTLTCGMAVYHVSSTCYWKFAGQTHMLVQQHVASSQSLASQLAYSQRACCQVLHRRSGFTFAAKRRREGWACRVQPCKPKAPGAASCRSHPGICDTGFQYTTLQMSQSTAITAALSPLPPGSLHAWLQNSCRTE